MTTRIVSAALGTVIGIRLLGGTATAQINSAPPTLMGQQSFHLYSVPGVADSGGSAPNGVRTFFSCTNTTSADVLVGVEVFDSGGVALDDASATSVNIPAGGTRTFSTGSELGWPPPVTILFTGNVNGSARVLAAAKKGIICSAFMVNGDNNPPTPTAKLSVVKTTKQKGE